MSDDPETDLKVELLKLAAAIVKEANAQGADGPLVQFADKVDAIDKLTRLYIAFQKHPQDPDDDDETAFSFDRGIKPEGRPNGSAATPGVSPRRRRAAGVLAGSTLPDAGRN